mgnify:CR=1 FL=1
MCLFCDQFFQFFPLSDEDTIGEFSCELYHIVMPASLVKRSGFLVIEILICDVHAADEGSTFWSEHIEKKNFGMVIFSKVFHSEWPPGTDKRKGDIIFLEKIFPCSSGKNIPSALSEGEKILKIIYP